MKAIFSLVVFNLCASPIVALGILAFRAEPGTANIVFLLLGASVFVGSACWGVARIIEATHPRPDTHLQIDNRRQMAIDARRELPAQNRMLEDT